MTEIIRMYTQLIARSNPTPWDACMQSTNLARKSSGRRRLEKPRRFNLLPNTRSRSAPTSTRRLPTTTLGTPFRAKKYASLLQNLRLTHPTSAPSQLDQPNSSTSCWCWNWALLPFDLNSGSLFFNHLDLEAKAESCSSDKLRLR